jgi:hypothetical protein
MDEQYMLIIVGAVVTSYGLVSALRLKRSAAWPRVEGRVVRSEKRVEHTDAGRLEDADIAYEYAFGGRVYTSRVVKVGGDMLTSPSKRPPSGADLLLAKYPVGRVVDVYVDPQHPTSEGGVPGEGGRRGRTPLDALRSGGRRGGNILRGNKSLPGQGYRRAVGIGVGRGPCPTGGKSPPLRLTVSPCQGIS